MDLHILLHLLFLGKITVSSFWNVYCNKLLVNQVDVVVGAFLVNDFQMSILQLYNLVFDLLAISKPAVIFYFLVNLRVLREDLTQQELLRKRKCLNFCYCHVNKLWLYVVAYVIITNYRLSTEVVRHNILNFFDWLLE